MSPFAHEPMVPGLPKDSTKLQATGQKGVSSNGHPSFSTTDSLEILVTPIANTQALNGKNEGLRVPLPDPSEVNPTPTRAPDIEINIKFNRNALIYQCLHGASVNG